MPLHQPGRHGARQGRRFDRTGRHRFRGVDDFNRVREIRILVREANDDRPIRGNGERQLAIVEAVEIQAAVQLRETGGQLQGRGLGRGIDREPIAIDRGLCC